MKTYHDIIVITGITFGVFNVGLIIYTIYTIIQVKKNFINNDTNEDIEKNLKYRFMEDELRRKATQQEERIFRRCIRFIKTIWYKIVNIFL